MFILNIQLYFMAWQIILKPFIIYFTFHTSIYLKKIGIRRKEKQSST